MSPRDTQLLEALYGIDGKAEVVRGEIVRLPPFGCLPGIVCANVLVSLHAWCQSHGLGVALGSTVGYEGAIIGGFLRTFCPDVSFKRLPVDVDSMRFVPGAPDFAVEVRGEDDYTPSAQIEIIEKRSDYFEAGTEVVWDVDTAGREIRRCHRDRPNEARVFRSDEEADAEPGSWLADQRERSVRTLSVRHRRSYVLMKIGFSEGEGGVGARVGERFPSKGQANDLRELYPCRRRACSLPVQLHQAGTRGECLMQLVTLISYILFCCIAIWGVFSIGFILWMHFAPIVPKSSGPDSETILRELEASNAMLDSMLASKVPAPIRREAIRCLKLKSYTEQDAIAMIEEAEHLALDPTDLNSLLDAVEEIQLGPTAYGAKYGFHAPPVDRIEFLTMGGYEFEGWVAATLRHRGFECRITSKSRDGGIDITAERQDELGIFTRLAIQCKNQSVPVGVVTVRELRGAVHPDSARPVICCPSGFTADAQRFAKQTNIVLWDFEDLRRLSIGYEYLP